MKSNLTTELPQKNTQRPLYIHRQLDLNVSNPRWYLLKLSKKIAKLQLESKSNDRTKESK